MTTRLLITAASLLLFDPAVAEAPKPPEVITMTIEQAQQLQEQFRMQGELIDQLMARIRKLESRYVCT